jgi:hypothetical protein
MKGGAEDKPEPPEDLGNLAAANLADNTRARVIPWHTGEAKFALTWISEPFAQYTQPAPAERSGKK